MKKYLSIVCAIAMLASLTGCGSSGSDSDSKTKSSNISETEEKTEKEEPTSVQVTIEPTTEEVTEAPTEKPTEKITEPVTEPETELKTEPATEAQVEVSLPQSTGDYVDYIGSQIDITDKSLMAAQMIGAEEGTSFKYNGNKFEIYRFKDGDPKLEEAASGSIMLTIEGFGEYESSASVNNNFIMIYNTPDDTVISAFNSLK